MYLLLAWIKNENKCFQSEIVKIKNRLQGKVTEMENFASHLEEIFLTVEVNV